MDASTVVVDGAISVSDGLRVDGDSVGDSVENRNGVIVGGTKIVGDNVGGTKTVGDNVGGTKTVGGIVGATEGLKVAGGVVGESVGDGLGGNVGGGLVGAGAPRVGEFVGFSDG